MGAPQKLGQLVILNGAPRSGKSSIAAAIQETFDGPWINLGVDRYMAMTPARYLPGIGLRPGGERPDLEPVVALLYAALYESMAAHCRLGVNVVADVGHHDAYANPRGILRECAIRLQGLPVLFVGVRCPLEVVRRRREETGTLARPGLGSTDPVLLWEQAVHDPGLYDMEIDTSRSAPREGAEAIARRLDTGPPGSAFQTLASRS